MSHDKMHKLVMMANQIAKGFRIEGEARAVPQIRTHIEKFWDPLMRSQMAAHVSAGGEGLDPLALEALKQIKLPASAP